MAATMHVFFDFAGSDAAPGTEQDVDGYGPPNLRFKTNDDATIDAINPIPIPTAGTKYSYWKQIYLECTVLGGMTQVDNVRFYTDEGGFGTGIVVKVGDQFPTKNTGSSAGYEVADGTPGDTGIEMVTGHSGISASTDAFSFGVGSPLTVSISESGSKIDAVGDTTNYVVLQMEVGTTASPGDLTDETFTFKYDEI